MSNPKDTKTMRSLVEAANSIDEAAKRTVTQYYSWETLRGNQTPTQSIYHVQVAGKPSGYGGEATGVELVVDSDGGWHISKMGRILLSGHGKPYPSAEAALAILKGGQGAWNPNDPKMRVNRLKESAEDETPKSKKGATVSFGYGTSPDRTERYTRKVPSPSVAGAVWYFLVSKGKRLDIVGGDRMGTRDVVLVRGGKTLARLVERLDRRKGTYGSWQVAYPDTPVRHSATYMGAPPMTYCSSFEEAVRIVEERVMAGSKP